MRLFKAKPKDTAAKGAAAEAPKSGAPGVDTTTAAVTEAAAPAPKAKPAPLPPQDPSGTQIMDGDVPTGAYIRRGLGGIGWYWVVESRSHAKLHKGLIARFGPYVAQAIIEGPLQDIRTGHLFVRVSIWLGNRPNKLRAMAMAMAEAGSGDSSKSATAA